MKKPQPQDAQGYVTNKYIGLKIGTLVISVALAIGMMPQVVHAQKSAAVQIQIAAQPLHQALLQLGQQTDIQIYYVPETVAGLQAPAINGTLTADQALQRLLVGTGINASWQGSHVSLQRQQSSEAQLGTVTVRAAAAENAESSYVAAASKSLKTPAPLIETPRSISVVTQEQIKTQAPTSIERALGYTAGVITETGGANDLRMSGSIIRGFSDGSSYFKDGLKQFAVGTYGSWNDDMNMLDSVEVLKGPASILYGQTRPGGVINVISKHPVLGQKNDIGISYGSYNRRELTVDLGGAIGEGDTVLYRLVALGRKAELGTDFSKDHRLMVAPSVTFNFSSKTSLTFLSQISQERTTPKPWWPSLFSYPASVDISTTMAEGDPNFNRFDRDTKSLGYEFEHEFDNGLRFTQNARYAEIDVYYEHLYASAIKADGHTVSRGSLLQKTNGKTFNIDSRLSKTLAWGTVRHQVSAGVDYLKYKQKGGVGYGSAPDLDMQNPVYWQNIGTPAIDYSTDDIAQTGLYVQDQIKWGNVVANIGVRHDKVREIADSGVATTTDSHATTGNVGLLYHFDNGFAPYVSYATSFEPVTGKGFDGEKFKPTKGKQFEVGVKYQPAESDSFITASLFDLYQQNVSTTDTNHPGFSEQTGEVHSQGLELEGNVALGKEWRVLAAYAYTDAVTEKSNYANRIGQPLQQVAKHTGSVWVDYRPRQLPGVMVAAGARYKDRAPYSLTGTNYTPSYTVLDAALAYETKSYRLSLNVVNLLDKKYYTGQFRGAEREFVVKANYYW